MGPRRVMIVEDDAETLELMREIFDAEGFDVSLASAISNDLHEIRDAQPELLVIDLRLAPEGYLLNGWDVVRLMKSHRELRAIRAVVISADAAGLHGHLDEAVGMDGVALLAKPFSLEMLLAMVNATLRQRHEAAAIGDQAKFAGDGAEAHGGQTSS